MNNSGGFGGRYYQASPTVRTPRLLQTGTIAILEQEITKTLSEEELSLKQTHALYELGAAVSKFHNVLCGNY